MFKVKFSEAQKIYSYHLDIYPLVQADNRKEKNRILKLADNILRAKIGNYACSGQNLYGIIAPNFDGGVKEPEGFQKGKNKVN